MAMDMNALILTKHLDEVTKRIKRELDKIPKVSVENAFQSVKVEDGQVKFYATTDKTGDVIGTFDLPTAMFLNQARTTIISEFIFDSSAYPGATDPNLNGKAVLVLAVKGDDDSTKYSFIDVSTLIDQYKAADSSIVVDGYNIKVKISAEANQALVLKEDGLHVDVSNKIDKVTNATTGNLAAWDSNGNVVDSTHGIAVDRDIMDMINTNFGTEQ